MKKPIDISKFRKDITKNLPNISLGCSDPETWISTGNYALNYIISGDFHKGIPLGKVSMLAGESGCLPHYANIRIRSTIENHPLNVEDGKMVSVAYLKNACERSEIYHGFDYATYEIHGYEISTPDGWQPVTHFIHKGMMPMVRIVTKDNYVSICASGHLIQLDDGTWRNAAYLQKNDVVITHTIDPDNEEFMTHSKIKEVSFLPVMEECFDFTVGHDNHRYWSDGFSSHNSGKSYIASGNLIKNAQDQGIFVILIDSESALDKQWLHNLGVDTSDDKLLKINASMIDDVAKIINDFVKDYKSEYGNVASEDRPKVLFVVDSVGMLMTPTDVAQFEKGDLKGDMGRKAKALKALITNCVNMFGEYEIGMVCTNHTYDSQNLFDPDPKVSGGSGIIYAASITIIMNKLKLKMDDEGNKISEVRGIRSVVKCVKTRFAKPFEQVEVQIPYETGMSPHSGLIELFEKAHILVKDGNKLKYTYLDGTEEKWFRKELVRDTTILDKIMLEFSSQMEKRDENLEEVDATESE